MMETVVQLKPDSEWRPKERWYSSWAPEWLRDAVLRRFWRDRITWDELVAEMDQALRIPGQTNAWTMPIKARIDMLTTGVRTPVGIKIYGSDLAEIERLGTEVEAALREVPGTRSAFAERAAGGYFVDLDLRRDEIAVRLRLVVPSAFPDPLPCTPTRSPSTSSSCPSVTLFPSSPHGLREAIPEAQTGVFMLRST
jgi:Cu/Ag efflux pump CusA